MEGRNAGHKPSIVKTTDFNRLDVTIYLMCSHYQALKERERYPLIRMFHKPVDEKRMVVILPPERYKDWLRAAPEHSKNFLVVHPADALIAVTPPLQAVNLST